jgi:NAD(P)-dependent dehydrogenase (short-subunit alcohol dehydrogenase family)
VIAPGTTDTAIFDGAPQEIKNSFVTIISVDLMDQPREIASDALFLASDDFSFVTGIELYVDSGTASLVESSNLTSGILFHLHSIFILQQ